MENVHAHVNMIKVDNLKKRYQQLLLSPSELNLGLSIIAVDQLVCAQLIRNRPFLGEMSWWVKRKVVAKAMKENVPKRSTGEYVG